MNRGTTGTGAAGSAVVGVGAGGDFAGTWGSRVRVASAVFTDDACPSIAKESAITPINERTATKSAQAKGAQRIGRWKPMMGYTVFIA